MFRVLLQMTYLHTHNVSYILVFAIVVYKELFQVLKIQIWMLNSVKILFELSMQDAGLNRFFM